MKKLMLKIIKYHLMLFCCCTGFVLSPHSVYAASITLAWDASVPSAISGVAGYKIYYGTQSGNYTYPPIDVGNVTSYTINDLDKNEIYYLAVSAYASGGEESEFSTELSTFNKFAGTAQIFSRKMQWGSCEREEGFGDSVEVNLSFNFLPAQDSFMLESEDTRITCNAGTFIKHDDNTIEAACVKKGPWGVTRYRFIFEGSGNASQKEPLSLSAEVFEVLTVFNQACPVYVIEMKDLLPVQE